MKRSVSNFLGSVSNVLSPPADDEGEEALLIQNEAPIPLTRFQVIFLTYLELFTCTEGPAQIEAGQVYHNNPC